MNLNPLKQHRNWLAWQLQKDGDRLLKFPIDVKTGRPAACDNPATWASYDEAKAAVATGAYESIGFALTKEVGLVIVDFDKVCSESGQFPSWVRREIEELDSYTEISASGRGAHVLVWGSVPENYNRQAHNIEIWGHNKMFALSEDIFEGRNEIRARDVSELHQRIAKGTVGPTYKSKLVVEKYDSAKFRNLCDDKWQAHGFASRSEAALSVLTVLAAKHKEDVDAIRAEFETTEICKARVEQGKWPRLANREIELALRYVREHKPDIGGPIQFAHTRVPGKVRDYVLLPKVRFDGWFGRGRVSIIGGSSGTGKTTLMVDALYRQGRREPFLGHAGAGLPYLLIFADRGELSNQETLERMGLDGANLPIEHMGICWDHEAVEQIKQLIEVQSTLPAVVFIEGADGLVSDPNKAQVVAPFLSDLQSIARYYHIAVVLSVGAPKTQPDKQHVLKRDRIFGSQMWARMADTVLTLGHEGDGTNEYRELDVMHRNSGSEKFRLVFEGGHLVEADPEAQPAEVIVDATVVANWAAKQSSFMLRDLQVQFPDTPRTELQRLLRHLEKAELVELNGKVFVPVSGREL